ncbi:unnamed protein product [Diplocarpon coronariae]|uniref:Uncharacterized protein n=1 Tax=Diplocarpon coronariae TaxID=2795749 RepID=A0A218YV39_9HELO|nr:hypothetical protein B2J93_438 [Marssonina coronariae]
MFNPYKKLAKFSEKRERLSFRTCMFMKLSSKSAIESDSSANEGSNASRGAYDAPPMLAFPDSRKDEREEGRRGVVGREIGLRVPEVDLLMLGSPWGVEEVIPKVSAKR